VADAEVDKLARRVVRLVEADTVDGVSSLRPGERLQLDERHEKLLKPLAQNLDLPARLAPMAHKFAHHGDPRWHDPREDARRGLTALVARSADALAPDSSLPPPENAKARDRLATAVTRAYAVNATPRLVEHLFPNGRPDDLGRFAPPQLEGDVAAARAMAIAIGARTAAREEDVLRKLVADGDGGAAYAAADLLLKNRTDYERLPDEQKPGIRRHLARSIEAGFAERDIREVKQREFTEELENRRADITGGAGTIDTASAMATDELGRLNTFLRDIDYWQRSAEPQLGEVRAAVARELVSRVEHHAGIDTPLTVGQVDSADAVPVAAAGTMVTMSGIPEENRAAAADATATMLTEGFDQLPARLAEWRADGLDVNQEAAQYGATLGDRTLAAVRAFEHQAPSGSDPAIPPLTRVKGATVRSGDGPAAVRDKGADGLIR
jgi:hypothetical protein